jgi:hypothetical protein
MAACHDQLIMQETRVSQYGLHVGFEYTVALRKINNRECTELRWKGQYTSAEITNSSVIIL